MDGNDLKMITQVSRMNAEERKKQIIEVAVKLFSQKGFRGTTTKDLAAACGINEALIFRHFASKSELYAAIMDMKACDSPISEMHDALEKAVEGNDDRKVFETIAIRVLEFHEADETAIRIFYYSMLEGHELSDMIFTNHIQRIHKHLAGYIKRRISDGAFRKVDPMTVVRSFMGGVIGQVVHKTFFPATDEVTKLSNRTVAERFTDIFLASLTNHSYEDTKAQSQKRK